MKAVPQKWQMIMHGIRFRWLIADGRAVRCEAVTKEGARFVSHSITQLISVLSTVTGDTGGAFLAQAIRLGGEQCARQKAARGAK